MKPSWITSENTTPHRSQHSGNHQNDRRQRLPRDQIDTVEVKGRDLVTGIPKILTIDSDEVREAISDQIKHHCGNRSRCPRQIPPELAADLVDSGIMLTGGGHC